jgi:hypothetical protein
VEQDPDSIKVTTNNTGSLPLHSACEGLASSYVVQYLVQKYPESIHVKNNDGMTPLHEAEKKNFQDVFNWLKSYLALRWVRAGELILLRALVDRERAQLNTSHSEMVGKKRKVETTCELELMNFVFRNSPDGVFALIMLCL